MRILQHSIRLNLLVCGLLICHTTIQAQIAPTSGKNYIVKRTPRDTASTLARLLGMPAAKQGATIEYYDGLGRPLQTVGVSSVPNSTGTAFYDQIIPHVYDGMGREYRQYLPLPKVQISAGGYLETAAIEQATYYGSQPGYGETVFDGSPLSRVVEQSAPGTSWMLGNGHTVATEYGTNAEGEVVFWSVSDAGELVNSGSHSAGTLYLTKVKDEDSTYTVEYKDFEGRVVRKVADAEGTCKAITDYVYDDFGRLRWVLPPKLMEKVTPIVFTNTEKSGIFTKQGCGTGKVGAAVTYTVEAGKYTSIINQADAEAKAQADVSNNGQAYANSVGSCYYLTPSALFASFISDGGSQTLSMESNTTWGATSSSSWITVSPITAGGGTLLTITCSANSGKARKGTVVVQSSSSNGGIRRDIEVTQECIPYLNVNQEMLEFDSNEGSALVAVSSSRPWTVTVDRGTFITAVKIDNETLSVKCSCNTTSSTRFCLITVGNGSKTKTIEVFQMGYIKEPPTASVNPQDKVAQ